MPRRALRQQRVVCVWMVVVGGGGRSSRRQTKGVDAAVGARVALATQPTTQCARAGGGGAGGRTMVAGTRPVSRRRSLTVMIGPLLASSSLASAHVK